MRIFIYTLILILNFSINSNSKEANTLEIDKYRLSNQANFIFDFKAFTSKDSVNAVIEIPKGTNEKWEVSKINGSLEHDFYMGEPRVINFSPYPVNYGMIPRTVIPLKYGGDGDPLDIIVLGEKIERGSVISVKVIGEMKMFDMGETDNKIIAVYKESKFFNYDNIHELNNDLPETFAKIKNWFLNYKKDKFIEFHSLKDKNDALKSIIQASEYFEKYGIRAR